MEQIIGVMGGMAPSDFKFNNDDDAVDKLSHRYTTALFCIFAVVVSTSQYVGEPIHCWAPSEFSGNWEEYTNSYCWIKNTYYLPLDEDIPGQHQPERRDSITYYQWIPLILLAQALFFYLPRMTWRALNNKTPIDVDHVVEQATTFQVSESAENREESLGLIVQLMDRFLVSRKHYQGGCNISLTAIFSKVFSALCGRKTGNYLTACYLVTKALYIGNVIGQLFLLNEFLGKDYHAYGIDFIQKLIRGAEWSDASRFPRVTMCDFHIRALGNIRRYTVQCVLSINLFNEMIYLVVWFWLVFVIIATCISLLRWALRMISRTDRRRFIKKHLRLLGKIHPTDDQATKDVNNAAIKQFLDDYLKMDGVFVLQLVSHNVDALTVTELVCALWDHFLNVYYSPPKALAPTASEETLLDDSDIENEDVNPKMNNTYV